MKVKIEPDEMRTILLLALDGWELNFANMGTASQILLGADAIRSRLIELIQQVNDEIKKKGGE